MLFQNIFQGVHIYITSNIRGRKKGNVLLEP